MSFVIISIPIVRPEILALSFLSGSAIVLYISDFRLELLFLLMKDFANYLQAITKL